MEDTAQLQVPVRQEKPRVPETKPQPEKSAPPPQVKETNSPPPVAEAPPQFMGKNYYEILGVSASATPQEIKQAYWDKLRQYHPDVNQKAWANEVTLTINHAYEMIKDPEKKAHYDQALKDEQEKLEQSRRELVKGSHLKNVPVYSPDQLAFARATAELIPTIEREQIQTETVFAMAVVEENTALSHEQRTALALAVTADKIAQALTTNETLRQILKAHADKQPEKQDEALSMSIIMVALCTTGAMMELMSDNPEAAAEIFTAILIAYASHGAEAADQLLRKRIKEYQKSATQKSTAPTPTSSSAPPEQLSPPVSYPELTSVVQTPSLESPATSPNTELAASQAPQLPASTEVDSPVVQEFVRMVNQPASATVPAPAPKSG